MPRQSEERSENRHRRKRSDNSDDEHHTKKSDRNRRELDEIKRRNRHGSSERPRHVSRERNDRHKRDRSDDENKRGRTLRDEREENHRHDRVRRDRHDNRDNERPNEMPEFRVKRENVNDNSEHAAKRWKGDKKEFQWGKPVEKETEKPEEKEKPNFEKSGKLTEHTNTYNGVVIKYNEPPEAKKPKTMWRLYPYKGDESLRVLHIHRQSAFLIGRDKRVADILLEHPSISQQHAVFQYRVVPYERVDGTKGRRVVPYIIDLDSSNGTFLNNEKIPTRRYVQLKERDILKFGFSSRDYVLLHSASDTAEYEAEDVSDDNAEEENND